MLVDLTVLEDKAAQHNQNIDNLIAQWKGKWPSYAERVQSRKLSQDILDNRRLHPGVYLADLNDEYDLRDCCTPAIVEDWSSDFLYGVADNYEQILNRHKYIADHPNKKFVILMTPIRQDEEPEVGGWRWHKWGEYIGTQHPVAEYIHDEPEIDMVYVFAIYRVEWNEIVFSL